jgi:hypothetical protein
LVVELPWLQVTSCLISKLHPPFIGMAKSTPVKKLSNLFSLLIYFLEKTMYFLTQLAIVTKELIVQKGKGESDSIHIKLLRQTTSWTA